jgi:hypothetical protein
MAGFESFSVNLTHHVMHTIGSPVVGPGCDDQFEFEFALDLLLDGFERLLPRA